MTRTAVALAGLGAARYYLVNDSQDNQLPNHAKLPFDNLLGRLRFGPSVGEAIIAAPCLPKSIPLTIMGTGHIGSYRPVDLPSDCIVNLDQTPNLLVLFKTQSSLVNITLDFKNADGEIIAGVPFHFAPHHRAHNRLTVVFPDTRGEWIFGFVPLNAFFLPRVKNRIVTSIVFSDPGGVLRLEDRWKHWPFADQLERIQLGLTERFGITVGRRRRDYVQKNVQIMGLGFMKQRPSGWPSSLTQLRDSAEDCLRIPSVCFSCYDSLRAHKFGGEMAVRLRVYREELLKFGAVIETAKTAAREAGYAPDDMRLSLYDGDSVRDKVCALDPLFKRKPSIRETLKDKPYWAVQFAPDRPPENTEQDELWIFIDKASGAPILTATLTLFRIL